MIRLISDLNCEKFPPTGEPCNAIKALGLPKRGSKLYVFLGSDVARGSADVGSAIAFLVFLVFLKNV